MALGDIDPQGFLGSRPGGQDKEEGEKFSGSHHDWAMDHATSDTVLGDFDGDPSRLTEMDALVAYLQMLGTLVDFSTYEPELNER